MDIDFDDIPIATPPIGQAKPPAAGPDKLAPYGIAGLIAGEDQRHAAPKPLSELTFDDIPVTGKGSAKSVKPVDDNPISGASDIAQSVATGDQPYTASPDVENANKLFIQELGAGVPIAGAFTPKSDQTVQFEKDHPGASGVMHALGTIAGTAPLMAIAPEMMGVEGGWGARLANNIGAGGAIGTGDSLARNMKERGQDFEHAMRNAAVPGILSALGGGAISGASSLIGGAVDPAIGLSERYLLNRGVPLSVGQTVGGLGKGAEDVAASVPIAGAGVHAARGDALAGFNRAALNEAHAQLDAVPGRAPTRAGNDSGFGGRQELRQAIQDQYDNAYNGTRLIVNPATATRPSMVNRMGQLIQDAQDTGHLQGAQADRLRDIVNGQIVDRIRNVPGRVYPQISGQAMSDADSNLRQLAARYGSSQVPDEQVLGQHITQIRQLLHNEFSGQRQNAGAGAIIDAADNAWAHYKVLQRAGASTATKEGGGVEGLFTPKQLEMSAKFKDPTVDKRATSENTQLFGELARHGQNVLPSQLGNSGSTDRAAGIAGAAGILPGMAIAPGTTTGILAALGTLRGLAQPGPQAAMRRAIAGSPQTREAIGPAVRGAGTPAAQAIMQALRGY